jgi:hypothetical protein
MRNRSACVEACCSKSQPLHRAADIHVLASAKKASVIERMSRKVCRYKTTLAEISAFMIRHSDASP